jgi:hypothetical protein
VSFPAKYRGKCTSCLEPIEVGQDVHFVGGDGYGRGGQLQHVECEEALVVPEHRAPVCEHCWLEKPCECDD